MIHGVVGLYGDEERKETGEKVDVVELTEMVRSPREDGIGLNEWTSEVGDATPMTPVSR